ncbi:54S ribosomal protein L9, mitochondrial [Bachmanniomyces sp. S44760]|nr:54S ribosomal protein L9, mitochondrial [Bachmanniomyces sp. S44760]
MPPNPPCCPFLLPPRFLLPRLHKISVLSTQQTRSIRSINPPRPNRFNRSSTLPLLESTTAASLKRKEYTTPLRTGALGIKKGMSAIYDPETGRRFGCTILQMDRVQVVAHKTRPKNGYWAVQVGAGWKHPSNVTRPLLGHFAEHGVSPKRHLFEFRVRDADGLHPVGAMITPSWFQEGQFVDARANCHGKGFAGGMKRHGFSGQPASHGTSLTHRAMGSAGQSQGGGSRVYPGKKMPGRMGGQQVTVQNIKVLRIDEENGIVVLNGSIPGPKNCVVRIQDAKKKPWPDIPVHPLEPATVTEPLRAAAA